MKKLMLLSILSLSAVWYFIPAQENFKSVSRSPQPSRAIAHQKQTVMNNPGPSLSEKEISEVIAKSLIDDEFNARIKELSRQGNYDEKKQILIAALQGGNVSRRNVSAAVSNELRIYLISDDENVPSGYYKDLVSAIETPEMKQDILDGLSLNEEESISEKEKIEELKSWFE